MSIRALALTSVLALLAVPALAADSKPTVGANTNVSADGSTDRVTVTRLIPFQGLLTDNGGNPITGGVTLDLTIYTAAAAGTALWSETQAVGVADGLFDVKLGAVSPLPFNLFPGDPRWLGISVDGEAELPRTELLPTPYAMLADEIAGQESGLTEVVSNTSNITIREYFLDAGFNGETGRIILSFNGSSEGGSGVATVISDGSTIETIAVPGGGGRPWTYQVPLALGLTVDVRVRADSALNPLLVRSINLQMDVAGAGAGNTLNEAYNEGGPGAGRLIRADAGPVEIIGVDGVRIGGAVDNGKLVMDYNGVTGLQVDDFVGLGQQLVMNEETGLTNFRLEPDGSGTGGYFVVTGGGGAQTFQIDGNRGGSGEPALDMFGASTITLDSSTTGDAAAILPASSVNAGELLNETGIAQGTNPGNQSITSTTMQDMVTVTITTPTSGYIVLEGAAQIGLVGTGDTRIAYQIEETAGGGTDGSYYHWAGVNGQVANTYFPMHARRTYFKSAGTYTFRLEAAQVGVGGTSRYFWNPVLTATFHPTGYGTVSTIASPAEAGQFSTVEATTPSENGGVMQSSDGVIVDLRELEMQVLRAEVALAAAREQQALAEAQAQQELGR